MACEMREQANAERDMKLANGATYAWERTRLLTVDSYTGCGPGHLRWGWLLMLMLIQGFKLILPNPCVSSAKAAPRFLPNSVGRNSFFYHENGRYQVAIREFLVKDPSFANRG